MDAEFPDGSDPVVDWRDAVSHASPPPELTTVGPDFAVVHEGPLVRRYADLEPGTHHELEGFAFTTLAPRGELLATFATVNDVHFGEEVCGEVHGTDIGPTFRSEPGDRPYPELMNRAAAAEISLLAPVAVLVKGDLTSNGTEAEYEAFRAVYEPAFGDRLHVIRGNHESYNHAPFARASIQRVDLPGVCAVLVDTSVDGSPSGTVTAEQLDEIDSIAASADRPVLLFGHHHVGDADSPERADHTFGIDLHASALLVDLISRRPIVRGFFSGHTHRNRVRTFEATGDVPYGEVASVKDFPGVWAEYRVYEDGILQIVHRISDPAALRWSDRTRHMFQGLYEDYAFGTLEGRCYEISIG